MLLAALSESSLNTDNFFTSFEKLQISQGVFVFPAGQVLPTSRRPRSAIRTPFKFERCSNPALKQVRTSSPFAGNFRPVGFPGESAGGVLRFLDGYVSKNLPIVLQVIFRLNDFSETKRGNASSTACGRKVTALPRMSCLRAPPCALSLGTHLAQKLRAVNLIRVFAFVRCALRLD